MVENHLNAALFLLRIFLYIAGTIESVFDRIICAIPSWDNQLDPSTNHYGALTFVSTDAMVDGAMFLLGKL